ncbi:DUF6371 domain-containing protein [Formosa sp. A9]|uniref:DUF6371 domain-containing protein n=1 Tax=Formosa sp. A9 TaxID=3442641 RepID=UPI003EB94F63
MNYKYTLDKSSRKFNCPSCNKKTFVRYVVVETNNYLEITLGRCDRESKCAYHKRPQHTTTTTPFVIKRPLPVPQVEPSCHHKAVIQYFTKDFMQNHFVLYLLKYFTPTQVRNALKKYFIGTSNKWQGATVFLQIDEQLNVCAGKIMLYDKNTGKRIKEPFPHITWLHKVLCIKDFVLQQCLFGLHNLCDYKKGSTVCIVESEKTAVIMSIIFPDYLWLATGSKANLKALLLKPLKEYNIILYPDKSEFEAWNTKTLTLKNMGFNISCSTFLEEKAIEEGDDLVDLLF